MDPEFQRPLTVVLIVATLIGVIGTVALYYVFRAFGEKKAGGSSHIGLMVGLLAFVFVCCAALLMLSYSGR